MSYIINITLYILEGCITTLKLYTVTALFSVPLGIVFALGKVSAPRLIKRLLGLYTWVFRGTPLLLQLFFFYYGLPAYGIKLSPFGAASVTFILNYGAYLTEIFRAGIESIDRGQYEASKVLGMNYWQTMIRIIIPQSIKRVLPPTANEAINLIKDTALIAAIAMGEISRAAKEIVTRDFTTSPFVIAAVIYLMLTSIIVSAFRKLEKKYSVYE